MNRWHNRSKIGLDYLRRFRTAAKFPYLVIRIKPTGGPMVQPTQSLNPHPPIDPQRVDHCRISTLCKPSTNEEGRARTWNLEEGKALTMLCYHQAK